MDGWMDVRTDGQGQQEREQPLRCLRMAAVGPSPSWACVVWVGWVEEEEEEVVERCVLVREWWVTRRLGWDSSQTILRGDAQVGLLAESFVERAFSWLSLHSKAGVLCIFFPGSALPFPQEESWEDHGPQMGTSGA